jgi:predicted HicB family RNase H-like nuclease
MTPQEFQTKLAIVPAAKPDAFDLKMLADVEAARDDADEGMTLGQIAAMRKHSGHITLRVPRALHSELAGMAKSQGVSLNQYCLYKLSR